MDKYEETKKKLSEWCDRQAELGLMRQFVVHKSHLKDVRKAAGDLPFTIDTFGFDKNYFYIEGDPIIYKKYRLLRKKSEG